MAGPDIFLSCNSEDAEVASCFAEGFEAEGFDVWWDQALHSGEAYDEVTEAAAKSAVRHLREVEPDMGLEQHVRQINFSTGNSDRVAGYIATFRRLWDSTEPDR